MGLNHSTLKYKGYSQVSVKTQNPSICLIIFLCDASWSMMAAGEPFLTSTFWQQRRESRKEQKGRSSHLSQPLKQPPTQDTHTYGHIQLKQLKIPSFIWCFHLY